MLRWRSLESFRCLILRGLEVLCWTNVLTSLLLPQRHKPDTRPEHNPVSHMAPKSTVAPKVQRLNFGMICCLFRYSRDAGYIKLIV